MNRNHIRFIRLKHYFFILLLSINFITFIIYILIQRFPNFKGSRFVIRSTNLISNKNRNKQIDNRTVFISAYFELEKSKHKKTEYLEWIKRLLPIINCRMIIYTSEYFYLNFFKNEIVQLPEYQQKLFNFNFTYSDAYEIPCISNLSKKFQEMHKHDPLRRYHNPNLYAIWTSKTFLVDSATYIYPDAYMYFWVDIGCAREEIMELQYDQYGNSYDKLSASKINKTTKLEHIKFPFSTFSDYIQNTYTDPPLEMCLFIVYKYVFPKDFSGHLPRNKNVVQAGGFFGTKNGVRKFNKIFWKVQNDWLSRNFFSGVEQDLFNFIFVHYNKEINFYVFPGFNQSSLYNGWFSFLSAFSDRNPCNDHYDLLKPDGFIMK